MKNFKLVFKGNINKKDGGESKKKKRANSIMMSVEQFKPIGREDQGFRRD